MASTDPPGTQPGRIRAAIGTDHADQLIPCGRDKRPLHRKWEQPQYVYSTRQLEQAPAIGLRFGISGLVAVDFDPPGDDPDAGERTFQHLTGRPSSDMPASWCWSSGRPGRRQLALLVPEPWRSRIKYQKIKNEQGITTLEIRWRGQQSVIAGHHPETGAYHWLAAPWDQPLAMAPDWLLEAIVPPAPAPIAPLPPPPAGAGWSARDAALYYLKYWPNNDLDYDDWWHTLCAMHRSGITESEARSWSSSSGKHQETEFIVQWRKVSRRANGCSVAWLGARTRAARERSRGK